MVAREGGRRSIAGFLTVLVVLNAGEVTATAESEQLLQSPPREAGFLAALPRHREGRALQDSNDTTTTTTSTATSTMTAMMNTTAVPVAAGSKSLDPLTIILPVVAALLCIGLVASIYGLLLYRQKQSSDAWTDQYRLDVLEPEYESNLLRLEKNVDLYSSKWDALPEMDERRQQSSSKHSIFVQKWDAFYKESKDFLDDQYTPEFRKRSPDIEVRKEGSMTVSGVSMRGVERQQKNGFWPSMPATPHKEMKRQLKVLDELQTKMSRTNEEFLDLKRQVFPNDTEGTALTELSKKEDLKPVFDPKVEEEVAHLRTFAHPLLRSVVVKNYDVLGCGENGPRPKPRVKVNAVVTDAAGWSHIGKVNNPKGAVGMSSAINDWLGMSTGDAKYPSVVHGHFNTGSEVEAEKKARFHSYDKGINVVHMISPKVFEVLQGLYDLSHAYLNVLTEFCRVIEGGSGAPSSSSDAVPRILRLTPFSASQLSNRKLEQHMGEVTWSALCMAFAMMPPMLHAQLREATIEVCVAKKKDFKLYEEGLDRRKSSVSSKPKLQSNNGRVESRYGSYDWVRHKNAPTDRLQRLCAMLMTQQATCNEGYVLPDGRQVELHPKDMLEATRLVTAPRDASTKQAMPIKITHGGTATTVMEAAIKAHSSGKKTVAVNAASAYSVGGGVLTGGRHALEETWCMVSTLLGSLQKVQWEQVQVRRRSITAVDPNPAEQLPQHIPVDGCILSPGVEIFRDTSGKGYPFHNSGIKILGVCSVAMFNMNPRVRDSPQDAPRDFDTYCRQVKQKFQAVLKACGELGAEVLICPDVGCGVFENDPQIVGSLFGQALRESGTNMPEIVVTGKDRFFSAFQAAATGAQVDITAPAYFSNNAGCTSSGTSPPLGSLQSVPGGGKPGEGRPGEGKPADDGQGTPEPSQPTPPTIVPGEVPRPAGRQDENPAGTEKKTFLEKLMGTPNKSAAQAAAGSSQGQAQAKAKPPEPAPKAAAKAAPKAAPAPASQAARPP